MTLPSGQATKASPGPDAAALSMGTPVFTDMCPITENITKPANTLVPQLINATIKESLKITNDQGKKQNKMKQIIR